MDLTKLQDLESYFADHFDTVLFPLLAEHYLTREDFARAHKVSQIGLNRYPDFIPGLFVEARTFLAEGDLKSAESLLKQIVRLDPGHFNAYVLLAEVQVGLARADSTVGRTFQRILQMDRRHEKARAWLEKRRKKTKIPTVKRRATKVEEKRLPNGAPESRPAVPPARPRRPRDTLADFPITPQVATFTLMAVLKSQKLYRQALEVLAVMSQKEGVDTERVEKEKMELMEHLRSDTGGV